MRNNLLDPSSVKIHWAIHQPPEEIEGELCCYEKCNDRLVIAMFTPLENGSKYTFTGFCENHIDDLLSRIVNTPNNYRAITNKDFYKVHPAWEIIPLPGNWKGIKCANHRFMGKKCNRESAFAGMMFLDDGLEEYSFAPLCMMHTQELIEMGLRWQKDSDNGRQEKWIGDYR